MEKIGQGVYVTLIAKDAKEIIKKQVPATLKGNFIHLEFKIESKKYQLLNIYSPENSTRPQTEFYDQLNKYVELINVKTDVVIFGGDFNLIASEIDSKTGIIKTGRRTLDLFNSIIHKLNIKDTYRYRNKNKRVYSWANFDNSSATRIDRIYLSKHICNKIKETIYTPFTRSDHKGYKLRISIGHIKWGTGFWKLNESLLKQKKYTELIRNFWNSWGKEKLKMNILDWWEKGKKSIKDISINYSKVMATKEKYKYKGLIQELEEEENKDKNDISNERINKIKKEIAILDDNRKKGVIIRSREEYYNGDLENIEIFELAEEKRGIKKEIRELYDKNGILRENKEEIINVVRDFYEGLYSSQKT
ncbi:Hypothetical predicted protein [Mytilus galloprovincialis]|uniref:Endonuclease/exonuclease/phosphatase domain-containing protein n=1 Tax=Mytilus galloprovincialis TaxID=29158 RepID=A0A8B6G662_MYTGA|nr:Hypothetical predicted protein [Mytilus galloprovincialis]